jgi:tetratricopeptide (TPR) repeat protein
MAEPKRIAEIQRRAASLMKELRYQDAANLLSKKSSDSGKYWRLSWNLGWCYFNLRRFNDARKHMMRANELAPDNAICKWGLGSVYLKKRQFKKAEAVLAESLRIKEWHNTRISLALAYLSQGKIAEAEEMHAENIKLKPKDAGRYESYAAFLSDVGREAEAEQILQMVKAMRSIH